MKKTMGKEYTEGDKRRAFLNDNCDGMEEKGFMRPYSPEVIQGKKEELAETSITINDLEIEKKESMKDFGDALKPLKKVRVDLLKGIKEKAEFHTEPCYKFVDQDEKETGYYNGDGDLIESRPANPKESQLGIFQEARKTGMA